MDFYEAVRRRRMVRNYTGEPVDPEAIDRIVDAARKAPSAGFSQGQAFVVVTDENIKGKVAEILGEPHYTDAGFDPWVSRSGALVVVLVSEDAYHRRYQEPDKLKTDGTEIDWPVPYWWVDAGASKMALLLAAVAEGLAAGFLGTSADGYEELKALLSIPGEYQPIGVVTIGHPAPDRRSGSLRRGWKPRDEAIHFNGW